METIEFVKTETSLVVLPDEVKELAKRVPESKQAEVQKLLTQIFSGTADWERQVDAIEVKDINDIMSIQLADVARKNAKNARLAAEKLFDAKREEVQSRMQDDKVEDALWLKSKQIAQIKFKAIEDKAEWKANFVKRYDAEQKELTTQLRIEKVSKFTNDINRIALENMSDQIFDIFLSGIERAFNDKLETERKQEEERLAVIETERVKQEAIRLENERLKKEVEEKEIEQNRLKIERKNTAFKFLSQSDFHVSVGGMTNKEGDHFIGENHYAEFNTDKELEGFQNRIKNEVDQKEKERLSEIKRKKDADVLRDVQERAEIERKKNAKILQDQKEKADKERAELVAKNEVQRKEKERLEKELAAKIAATEKLKRDAELKLQADKKAKEKAEKAALKAPDKVKLTKAIRDLFIPDLELKSEESRMIERDIRLKFMSFKLWCETQIKTI